MSTRDRPIRPDPSESGRPRRLTPCPARWSRRTVAPPADLSWLGQDGLSLLGSPADEGTELRTVLLVDGDDFARETLGRILEADGYRVTEAADGAEALARLREPPAPGLILLDLLTPGVGGWRSLRRLRRDPACRDVPVIVVSALDAPATYGRQAGIVACFEKPIAASALRAEIRRHLPPR
jgi:CheY-like chemotaxis protein